MLCLFPRAPSTGVKGSLRSVLTAAPATRQDTQRQGTGEPPGSVIASSRTTVGEPPWRAGSRWGTPCPRLYRQRPGSSVQGVGAGRDLGERYRGAAPGRARARVHAPVPGATQTLGQAGIKGET
jgi:hypothetical protein